MLHHMTADLIMQFTAVNTLTWAYSLIIEDIPPTHGRSLPTSNNRIFWENLYQINMKKTDRRMHKSSLYKTQIWMFRYLDIHCQF